MLSDSSSIHELWDLEKPIIPERSCLHHLNPVGVGSPLVESLTSYVARLAKSHNVFLGVLISRELAPLIEKVYVKTSAGMGLRALFNRATALNGTGIMAKDFVQALEKLTLQKNLQFLTLLFWADVILPKELFRDNKSWCPVCYQEWNLSQKEIYDPLLWTISIVKFCPQHNKFLCERCPNCHQKISLLTWKTQPGYCSNCGGWLGKNSSTTSYIESHDSKYLSKKELQWETWVAQVIGELIASTPYLASAPPKENIAKSLGRAIEIVTDGNIAAFASLVELPKNTVWMWQRGKALPRVDLLLKICHFLGVSLLDFLTSEDIGNLVKTILNQSQQRSRRTRISPKSFDYEQVQDALVTVLANDEIPPLTMKEAAQRLGYDRRTIFQHFPELCRDISAKYLNYSKELRLTNIELSCREVQDIAVILCDKGVYPTENLVSKSMTKPGYLRYKEVRATLQQAQGNFPR
ncbi:TniQ family protein [Nostoc edaphicum CCNP1411]|uniref:TniQ family protein n=1 Tax=Nostoc edaphicum CCNP1411 TaxID=1472755 RepID=A0A7D7QP86_9NOSO|nr:TniQ family protein [Nostoc edaphicum]QMS92344.1 TniQ family protein [Nostoc edaphicum CCNP1411]